MLTLMAVCPGLRGLILTIASILAIHFLPSIYFQDFR